MRQTTSAIERAPRPPAGWTLAREMSSAAYDVASWSPVRPYRRLARGDGHTVLVLPGFGAGNASTSILRANLRRLSYDARGWSLGLNRGHVEEAIALVSDATVAAARSHGPVSLVGWSLGGVIAREAARLEPAHVRQVVTLGSPVVGGPKYTHVGRWYQLLGHDLDAVERQVEELNQIPLTVPVTAVFSKTDGIVDWPACIDPWNTHVEHVEVRASHFGMGHSRAVLEVVADRLATNGPAGASAAVRESVVAVGSHTGRGGRADPDEAARS